MIFKILCKFGSFIVNIRARYLYNNIVLLFVQMDHKISIQVAYLGKSAIWGKF